MKVSTKKAADGGFENRNVLESNKTRKHDVQVQISNGKKFPPVVYGLKGICELFNLKSECTASKWSRTILKDACAKQGKLIVVDVKKAFELFGCLEPENFMKE